MHQTRQKAARLLPIPRKGTKYVARASSHIELSIPVLLAIRDMLKLAKTTKEVKEMIKQKLLKINGRIVKDFKESIKLFNILEAGNNNYKLTILSNAKFNLQETNSKERICKVINKIILKDKKIQLNMHDGTNIISNEKIHVNDSVYLDFSNKVKKQVSIDVGKTAFIFSGKHIGRSGKIELIKGNNSVIKLNGEEADIDNKRFFVL